MFEVQGLSGCMYSQSALVVCLYGIILCHSWCIVTLNSYPQKKNFRKICPLLLELSQSQTKQQTERHTHPQTQPPIEGYNQCNSQVCVCVYWHPVHKLSSGRNRWVVYRVVFQSELQLAVSCVCHMCCLCDFSLQKA